MGGARLFGKGFLASEGMSRKDDKEGKEETAFSDSAELFDTIFRKARKDEGLLIKDLAQRIGVSSDRIINWELRDVKPAKRNLAKLKKVLQV